MTFQSVELINESASASIILCQNYIHNVWRKSCNVPPNKTQNKPILKTSQIAVSDLSSTVY
jgi:hypothetical protein